jgi:hypothetical protein
VCNTLGILVCYYTLLQLLLLVLLLCGSVLVNQCVPAKLDSMMSHKLLEIITIPLLLLLTAIAAESCCYYCLLQCAVLCAVLQLTLSS